jgi:phosphohistidine phosphatase
MMDLYILRHAIAVQRGTSGNASDSDRSLTPAGKKKMRCIARGMKALGLEFDLILSSPLRRARQTAEIVAREFKVEKKLEFTPHLEVGGDPERLVRDLADRHGPLKSILLVGHEPQLSCLISVLVFGSDAADVVMKKGGLCKLTADSLCYGRCAMLKWLLTPGQMIRIR